METRAENTLLRKLLRASLGAVLAVGLAPVGAFAAEGASPSASAPSAESAQENTAEQSDTADAGRSLSLLDEEGSTVFDPNNPAFPVTVGSYEPGEYTVTANVFIPGALNPLVTVQAYATNGNNPLGMNEYNDPYFKIGLPNVHQEDNAKLVVGADDSLTLSLTLRNPVFTIQGIGSGENVEVVSTTTRNGAYGDLTSRIENVTFKLGNSLKTHDGSDGYTLGDCTEYPTLIKEYWHVPLSLTVDFSKVAKKGESVDKIVAEPKPVSGLVYAGIGQTGVVLAAHSHVVEGNIEAVGAGKYAASVVPDEGYTWSDGSTDVRECSWSIARAPLSVNYRQVAPSDTTMLPSEDEVNRAIKVEGFVNGEAPESLGDVYTAPVIEKWRVSHWDRELNKGVAETVSLEDAASIVLASGTVAAASLAIPELANYTFYSTYHNPHGPDQVKLNSKHCHFVVALSAEQMPADAHAVYTGQRQSGIATGNGVVLPQLFQSSNEASWFWNAYNRGPLLTNEDYIATEAGTYTVKLMPANEHAWADMTDAPRWLTYTIEKAPLTAQVLDETIAVGDTPTLRVVASGFVNGEDRSTCISYESPVATAPESLEAGKSYKVVPEGGSAANYRFIEYLSGTVTVLPQGKAPVPAAAEGLVYTGKEQVGVPESTAYTSVGTSKATAAGDYHVTVTLKDGFEWADGSTEKVRSFDWSIAKAPLTALYHGETFATGETPEYKVEVSGFVNGETSETAAGYVAPTVKLPDGYTPGRKYYLTPSDGAADNYSFIYKEPTTFTAEAPKPVALMPIVNEPLVYTGLEQVGVKGRPGSALVGQKSAVDAGSYTVVATLLESEGYSMWFTFTKAPLTLAWSIAQAPLAAAYKSETVEYGDVPALEVEVTGFVNGETAATAADYAPPSVALPETLEAGKTYELVPAGGSAKNYAFETYTPGTLTVVAKKIAKPVAAKGLTSNGSEQVGVPEGTGYALSGTAKASKAGSYTAVATLNEGYTWDDGSTDPLTITWSIAKGDAAWSRLAGATAIDTMAAITAEGWDAGSCKTVVLASADGYWDALTASALAGAYGCPVLITNGSELSSVTAAEIKRLGAETVLVCGGEFSVSDEVKAAVEALGVKAERLFGRTAADTAIEVAKRAASVRAANACVVATSASFYDALSVSPWSYASAMPVYLTDSAGMLSAETLAAIKAAGYEHAYIVGGEYSVSAAAARALAAEGGIAAANVERLFGQSAWATSAAIAEAQIKAGAADPAVFGVADGNGYWDALTGAALCGKRQAALLLVPHDGAAYEGGSFSYDPLCIDTVLKAHADKVDAGYVFGGESSVPVSTFDALKAATKAAQG